MANHKYTSLTELLDAPKTREPIVSNGSGYDSDDHSFTTEMFGELYFRERSSLSSTKTSVWDLFNPPLPPPKRPLHDHAKAEVEGLKEGAALDDPDQVPALEKNGKKMGKGKAKLTEKKCCKYDNSGKLFPPPISTLKMNRAGKPLIYHEFDTGKTGFVPKLIFLPHEIMAATSGSGGCLQRMRNPRDHEEEKEPAKATDDEAEQKVPPNAVKAAGNNKKKKQV